MSYTTPKLAAIHYKITTTALQNWANEDRIEYITLPSGHRRYKIGSLKTDALEEDRQKNAREKTYIYCRVSSAKQSDDLQRQIAHLREKYPTYELITDIGSGLNFKRKGFKRILEQLLRKTVKTVVVAYRDRWARFGFEFFEWLFAQFDAELKSDGSQELKSKEQELTEDLMSILGVFTAKYNGSRKYIDKETKKEESDKYSTDGNEEDEDSDV